MKKMNLRIETSYEEDQRPILNHNYLDQSSENNSEIKMIPEMAFINFNNRKIIDQQLTAKQYFDFDQFLEQGQNKPNHTYQQKPKSNFKSILTNSCIQDISFTRQDLRDTKKIETNFLGSPKFSIKPQKKKIENNKSQILINKSKQRVNKMQIQNPQISQRVDNNKIPNHPLNINFRLLKEQIDDMKEMLNIIKKQQFNQKIKRQYKEKNNNQTQRDKKSNKLVNKQKRVNSYIVNKLQTKYNYTTDNFPKYKAIDRNFRRKYYTPHNWLPNSMNLGRHCILEKI